MASRERLLCRCLQENPPFGIRVCPRLLPELPETDVMDILWGVFVWMWCKAKLTGLFTDRGHGALSSIGQVAQNKQVLYNAAGVK